MKGRPGLVAIAALGLGLALGAGLGFAQGPGSGADADAQAEPAGTSFTYQGRLVDDGVAVSGAYDFEFTLHDHVAATGQVGSPVTVDDVEVNDGLFTVELDFGAGVFQGDARWLEIGVRPGESEGAYTTLAPRQALVTAPYAHYALTAPWSGLEGVPPDFEDGVDDDTTYAPGTGLELVGTTFSANTDYLQRRVGGTCGAGSAMRSIDSGGNVTCEVDDDTTYGAGTGLEQVGTTFSADTGYLQRRVSGTCGAGSAIRVVNSNGTVTCESDSNTTYGAGTGLDLVGTTFSADTGYLQRRVSGTCSAGNAIRAVDSNGTVSCESVEADAHDHWGESWSGSGTGLTLDSSDADGVEITADRWGVRVQSAGHDGVRVFSAGHDGVHVVEAGYDGVHVVEAGNPTDWESSSAANGFEVAGAEGNGLFVGRADDNGVYVESAGVIGVYVGGAGSYGVAVGEAGKDGVYVYEAGSPSTRNYSSANDGFEVDGAEGHGLFVGRADENGVSVVEAGNDGVYVDKAGNPSTQYYSGDENGVEVAGAEGHGLFVGRADKHGVWVQSAGEYGVVVTGAGSDGMYADTSATYGFNTPDKIYTGGGCVGCTSMLIAMNGDDVVLEPGDLVAVAGLTESVNPDAVRPILIVRKAEDSFGQGVVGVVEGHYVYEAVTRKTPTGGAEDARREGTSFPERVTETIREEPAAPGEYLSVVYRGLARVKVDATASPIGVGDPLSVSNTVGRAMRAQQSAVEGAAAAGCSPGTVVGKAVEPLSHGQGFIWVLVDLQ
jgi:hypothetical protein